MDVRLRLASLVVDMRELRTKRQSQKWMRTFRPCVPNKVLDSFYSDVRVERHVFAFARDEKEGQRGFGRVGDFRWLRVFL